MRYKLVLQWPASSIGDYDSMIAMEDLLIERLTGDSEVDGHDAGSGEMNIFVRTSNPQRAFAEVRNALADQAHWKDVRVAYRDVEGGAYNILWPKGLATFKVE